MVDVSIVKSTSYDTSESVDEDDTTSEVKKVLTNEELAIRNALLDRAYHLPGNNYIQDLYQYLTNNHPLFGIWFHNPLHPVGVGLRFVAFCGSIVFGLAITNIIYIGFVLKDQEFNNSLLKLNIVDKSITGNADFDKHMKVNVTSGMIALWTIGSAMNALYDNLIWTFAACVWCLPGGRWEHLEKYRKYTPYLIMFVVVGTTAVASLAVLIVAASKANQEDENLAIKFGLNFNSEAESYRFLLSYSMEVALSLAVWNPLMGALLFSGV